MSKKYGLNELEKEYDAHINKAFIQLKDEKKEFYDPMTEKYRHMILINTNNGNSYFYEKNNVDL